MTNAERYYIINPSKKQVLLRNFFFDKKNAAISRTDIRRQKMQDAQTYTIVALCVYAIAMALVGCMSYGKSKTLDGFLVGGRNIGPWLTAFAYGTTYFSAVVFVGYAGQHGWNIGIGAMWIGIGNAVLGCLLSWLLFANKTRKMT